MVPQAELMELDFASVQEFAPHRDEIRRLFSQNLGESRECSFSWRLTKR